MSSASILLLLLRGSSHLNFSSRCCWCGAVGWLAAGRHAAAPRSDPHLLAKHRFVVEVAEQINQHAHGHVFDQLVLIAPAHALHDLRAALSKTATAKVVGSETHDLVKIPDHALPSHLAKWWLAPP